ncbi:28S ribosomal protein S7, mitochondrial [Holothuria leucospilota]|uniref:28S ribosomal protein S7, mitochondrial n=1 Tax=Holothuria leucospilota TaxID=206669 RepID=A0A9Q1C3Q5_HOLLE|nr:28S ribosomal protein S7, mitochondrial [Holothuria leucospilota]
MSTSLLKCMVVFWCISRVTQVRHSRYPPTFVEPVVKKESFETELPFDVSTPVKAAPLWRTSSFTYDPLILKFINIIQKKGEKDLASYLMRKTFEQIKLRQVEKVNTAPPGDLPEIELNPKKIFHEAIENSKPLLGLQNVERGGRTYQVPTPLKESRRRFLAMKWLIEAANNKEPVIPFYQKLADELMDAYQNTGAVVKRKNDLHKQCEANRAYAHFRWW